MNFREFEIIGGEKVYIDKVSIRFVDTELIETHIVKGGMQTYPVVKNIFYIPGGFLYFNNRIFFSYLNTSTNLYETKYQYVIEEFYGAGKFGDIVAVFVKRDGAKELFIYANENITITQLNKDIQHFKQINQFSFILTYNDSNNSIIALYDLTSLENINTAIPFATAVFPKSYNHLLMKEDKDYVFTTEDFTSYLSIIVEPYPLIKTNLFVNYKLYAYELLPFHNKLLKNSKIINEVDNGYCLKSLDADSYVYLSDDILLYGKNFIPVDRRHFVSIRNEISNIDGIDFYILKIEVYKIKSLTNLKDTSLRLFQAKQNFNQTVFVESVSFDFNYITDRNADIDLIIDTSYNGLVRSFRYKVNPDKGFYKIGVKCDRLVLSLISNTGAEFNGQVVIKDYKGVG